MRREWIRCGETCRECGKDEWFVFLGSNRCACGQQLWIERVRDDEGDTRFPYAQGPALPVGYPGWMRTTK